MCEPARHVVGNLELHRDDRGNPLLNETLRGAGERIRP